jgi:uncharacterized protein (TIGR00725 family)
LSRPKTIAIFGSSATEPGSPQWAEAEEAGARCARAGLAVVTGGYGGTMEAASKGAAGAGATVIGVTAPVLFEERSGANRYVTEEIQAPTLSGRLGVLTELAAGALVLPGSVGTAAELVVAWNMNHLARLGGGRRLPTVAVGEGWRQLWQLIAGQLGAFGEDVSLADTAQEALDWLLDQPEIR